jgi:hypothetical protein
VPKSYDLGRTALQGSSNFGELFETGPEDSKAKKMIFKAKQCKLKVGRLEGGHDNTVLEMVKLGLQ